ncbi:MAG: putative ABC transporter permease [Collinsella sp.]
MLNHGRFANSGFLLGPCCPIYGVRHCLLACCCAGFRMPRPSLSLQRRMQRD